jgi:hypothetical protein
MKKKLRKSLWGLQWIFLKNEKIFNRSPKPKKSEISEYQSYTTAEMLDFPEISLRKQDDINSPTVRMSDISTRENYRMTHIEDLPTLQYKNPHIHLDTDPEFENQKPPLRSLQTPKNPRPKTVEIRRLVIPQKFVPKYVKPEPDTNPNRRKNYGKWFIPPEKWKNSLEVFIKNSSKSP